MERVERTDILSFGEYSFGRPYSAPVSFLGTNPDDPGQIYLFDLSQDPRDISGLDDYALQQALSKTPRPIRRVRANKCPTLLSSAWPVLKDDLPDAETLIERALYLRDAPEFAARVQLAFQETRPEYEKSSVVEKRIYDGFLSGKDRQLLTRFHAAPWPERPSIVGQLQDERYRELGQRLIYIEQGPQSGLDAAVCDSVRRDINARVSGGSFEQRGRSARTAMYELDDLVAEMPEAKGPFATTVLEFYRELEDSCASTN